MNDRILVVNADDFGRSPGVNAGIIEAHQRGVVTSTTLMVRWPDAPAAAAYGRDSDLAVGLHLDLGEWAYRDGEWRELYLVVDGGDAAAVDAEVGAQLGRFEELMGSPPTHLDSHQHVHREGPARAALLAAGERLRVPVRWFAPGIAYSGVFYGQSGRGEPAHGAIAPEALAAAIEALPEGVTEFGCHPAAADDHDTMYRSERLVELETLCDPRVRAAIKRAGVELRSFAELDRGPKR